MAVNWNSPQRRRGSVTVLALMVSLLVMILVTATMTMTIIHNDIMGDFTRNKKTIQASDSGMEHGRRKLNTAIAVWNMPSGIQPDDVAQYTADANSGNRTNNRDLSILVAAGGNAAGGNFESILPRNTTVASAVLDPGPLVPAVNYTASVDVFPTSVTLPVAGDITDKHVFHYTYTLTSEGDANIGGQHNQATRVTSGAFDLEVKRPSFSTYGYFTEHMKDSLGSQLWFYDGENYDGPTHVNSTTDSSAFYGRPHFKGDFTSVQGSPGNTYLNSGAVLAGGANPDFQAGQTWGVPKIDTPTNGWSQLRAALGNTNGAGNTVAPTNSEIRQWLGIASGNAAVPQGAYYAPNNNASGSANPLGGIYVNGDAQEISLNTNGTTQTITIKMNISDGGPFNGSQTWVFTDNQVSNTMSVTKNGSPAGSWNQSLNGVIHVGGNVLSLKGNGLGTADIQPNEQMTLSVDKDIIVNDNITYSSDPTVNPNATNVLGLFSSGGNIMLGTAAPANLNLHATVMAVAAGKGVGAQNLVTNGNYDKSYANKGKWNLLGGLIENTDQTTGVVYSDGTATGYQWNFTYDKRFKSGVAPPYFPYVTKYVASVQNYSLGAEGRKYY